MSALFNARIKTLGRVLILIVSLLGLVLVASALETRSRVSQIETVWKQFEDGRSDKRRVLNELYADLGYGGMIHGFKNYVLRQESDAVVFISSKLRSAQESLTRYKALGTNDAEDQALAKMTVVLEDYATALRVAETLVKHGSSSREIDAAVKVDDGPAFRALNELDELSNYRDTETLDSDHSWKLINELRRALGYGGLIHQIKNYVLRHEPSYLDAARDSVSRTQDILRQYAGHNPSKAEQVALQTIGTVLDQYINNLEIAQSLVEQGKTPREIDQVIQVDDRLAFKGLASLIREVRAQNAIQAATVDRGLKLVVTLSELMIVFTLVASCLIIGFTFWLIRLQIVRPIQHLAGVMQQLAQGNLDIEVPVSEQRNEIGEMINAVGVFKQNSVERARAEKAVLEAKNELERRVEERTMELKENRDRLRLVTDNLPVMIAYVDAQQRWSFVSKIGSEWLARPFEEIIGKSIREVFGQEYEKIQSRIEKALAGEQLTYKDTVTYPDNVTRTVQVTYVPHRGEDGIVEGYISLTEDVSELQQTEEALRQAQKMEAVGQLTGGVAHDFNNLLAIILGNTELLEIELGDNPLLTTIDRAATRGAELTQRLLTFARQQALQPQSIDLTELIPGLDDLFQRTLGEPVKLSMDVPAGIWPVSTDPGQLESALLNLAINARDAMPEGGVLEINCENIQVRGSDKVAAGDYVQISVRDSGSGMPVDVLEHVFEPFFTTKDVGEGSGLGLSIVYGFVRQSGGDATIESEPGTGTVVKLLLPRSEVTNMLNEPTQNEDMNSGQGQEEAILVLEDDPDVRSFAVNALEGLGYRVHQAADAAAAMRVLEEEADKLDLLLSDVVLPGGVSGPELAAKAKDLYPKLKLVFMSGYAADLYTHDKIPGFDEILLTKPFRLAELSKAVHDTLAA